METGLLQEVTTDTLDASNQPPESFAVAEDSTYRLEIVQQPSYQRCTVEGGVGTEDNNLVINCVDLERSFASIALLGVPVNKQVTVKLEILEEVSQNFVNDQGIVESREVLTTNPNRTQSITYAQSAQLNPNAQAMFTFDEIGMIDGDRYRLSIDTHNTSEEITCSVGTDISNVIQSEDFEFQSAIDGVTPRPVNCQDDELLNNLPQFNLSGTIQGLGNRDGLRLIPFESGSELEIAAGSTSFSFENLATPLLLSRNDDYDIQIERQPEGGYCTVQNGSGEIQTNVDDIEVHCEPAYSVRINLSNIDGLTVDDEVAVKVQLFSSSSSRKNSRLVAQDDGTVIIDDNSSASIDLQDLDEHIANLPAGNYHLYVWLNMNGSTDSNTGDPTFDDDDKALYRLISLEGNQALISKSYNFSHFGDVTAVEVKVNIDSSRRNNTDYQNAGMECIITHPEGDNTARGLRGIPYPRADYRPIISTASRICTENCDSNAEKDAMYTTNYKGYAVSGTAIDIFCIVDLNNNNRLDSEDIYARINNTTARSSTIITNPVE